MKVRILKKVSSFFYEGHDYKPGDIAEIPTRLYRKDFMEEIKPAPPPKKSTEETTDTDTETYTDTLKVEPVTTEPPKYKPKPRRRSIS